MSPSRACTVILGLFVVAALSSAATASNSVPPTRLGQSAMAAGANDKKPSACASLLLSSLVAGTGTVTGTGANELLLGSSDIDAADGGDGDDCVVGGDGDDSLSGGAGTDVCIGGPGVDSFSGCETTID